MNFKAVGDRIDPTKVVGINEPVGRAGEAGARIWPFKVHRGKQAYDTENNTLIVAHTAGEDETALWHNYDWPKAIQTGMAAAGLPWSGKYGFVSTEMSWPITHMVAPKGDALGCAQCHGENSRLQGIDGIYMPGVSNNHWVDLAGWTAVVLALIGVLIHGGMRMCVLCRRKEK